MKRMIPVLVILIGLNGICLAFEPLFDTRIDYGVGHHLTSAFVVYLESDGDKDLALANYCLGNALYLINLTRFPFPKKHSTMLVSVQLFNPFNICKGEGKNENVD